MEGGAMERDLNFLKTNTEEIIEKQLKELINYELVDYLLNKVNGKNSKSDLIGNLMKNNEFWITQEFSPKLYDKFREIKDKIGVEEDIELYISNNIEMNAISICGYKDYAKGRIILNSAMLEKFNDDELSAVLGHEIGHIVFRHGNLDRCLNHIFSNIKEMPAFIRLKILTWKNLSEISADRVGLLASDKLESNYSAMFKLYTGLGAEVIDFDNANFDKYIDKIVDNHSSSTVDYSYTHPPIPLRIKAMRMFAGTDSYKNRAKKIDSKDNEFENNLFIEVILKILKTPINSFEEAYSDFIYCAGGLIMGVDDVVSEEEKKRLLNLLSSVIDPCIENPLPPTKEILQKSAKFIEENSPERRMECLQDLIYIALHENISNAEYEIIKEIALKYLHLVESEIDNAFLYMIQRLFSL